MNPKTVREICERSVTENLSFREVLDLLGEAGVANYSADLLQRQKTYYSSSGEVYTSKLETSVGEIPANFDLNALKEAVEASHQGKINYAEFLRRIVAAGVFSYSVHLRKREAIYFGRSGDFHVEHIPF